MCRLMTLERWWFVWFVWFGWCLSLDDGSAGGWFGGVAVSGGCGQGEGSVGVVDGFPAPGGGVFDDVVVLAEGHEVVQGGGAGLGEGDAVVAVAFAGGSVAAGPGADRVPCQRCLGEEFNTA